MAIMRPPQLASNSLAKAHRVVAKVHRLGDNVRYIVYERTKLAIHCHDGCTYVEDMPVDTYNAIVRELTNGDASTQVEEEYFIM